MDENKIFKQVIGDWKELEKRFKKDGTLVYGVVKGFVIDRKFQKYVYINMGNGQSIVFNSIQAVELKLKRE